MRKMWNTLHAMNSISYVDISSQAKATPALRAATARYTQDPQAPGSREEALGLRRV